MGKNRPARNEIQFSYIISQLTAADLTQLKALALARLRATSRRVWIMAPDLFDRRQVNLLGSPRRRHSDSLWEE